MPSHCDTPYIRLQFRHAAIFSKFPAQYFACLQKTMSGSVCRHKSIHTRSPDQIGRKHKHGSVSHVSQHNFSYFDLIYTSLGREGRSQLQHKWLRRNENGTRDRFFWHERYRSRTRILFREYSNFGLKDSSSRNAPFQYLRMHFIRKKGWPLAHRNIIDMSQHSVVPLFRIHLIIMIRQHRRVRWRVTPLRMCARVGQNYPCDWCRR